MHRALFAGVVLLHGIIHVMGFMKAFRLADLPQLQLDITDIRYNQREHFR